MTCRLLLLMFLSVSLSVYHAALFGFIRVRCTKTAERIEVLFGLKTLRGPRNIVLDGGPDLPTERERRSAFDAIFAKSL